MARGKIRHMLWTTALFGDRAGWVRLVSAVGLTLALVGAWLGTHSGDDPLLGAALCGGTLLALPAAYLWARFCDGAVLQNSPANARLVPGLNRGVRQCAVLGWVAAMACLLPLAYGHPDGAVLYPLAGIALVGLGLWRAGHVDGLTVMVAAPLFYAFGSMSASLMHALSQPLGMALSTLVCLAYGAWALPRAFPIAGERHWRMCGKQQVIMAMRDRASLDKMGRNSWASHRSYAWLLARDCRGPTHPADLLLHGLGPGNHRYWLALMLAYLMVLILLVKAVTLMLALPDVSRTLTWWLVVALAICWGRFSMSIRRTGGEQALLRLAPAMPSAPSLNRVLGRRIAAIALLEWTACALIALGTLALWDSGASAYRVGAVVAAILLAATGYSLDDYARKQQTGFLGNLLLALWMAALLVAGIITQGRPLAWSGVFALAAASSLLYIWRRWRRMQRGPVAFPANRMD